MVHLVLTKRKASLVFLLTMGLLLFSSLPTAQAGKYKEGKVCDVTITWMGSSSHPDGTKYTYEVDSGSKSSRIRYWYLKSSAFKVYKVVESSEKAKQWKNSRILFFPKNYKNDDVRTVWFVLEHEYIPPTIKMIRYRVKVGGWGRCKGKVLGPSAPLT